MYSDLLSFVSNNDSDYIEPSDENIKPGSIWDKLMKAITARVRIDGIRKEAILSGQSAASVTTNAAENIYYDIAEFYDWYFEPEDERYDIMKYQKAATILSPLRAVVKPVVEHNLSDMRDAELIPVDQDSDNLVDTVTDNLTRYILDWQDWYYDRKEQEEIDDYFFDKSLYEAIYSDSDYGDMSNNTNYLDDDIDNPEEY